MKCQLITIDKLSDLDFYYENDYCVINLNNVVPTVKTPYVRLIATVSEILANRKTNKINLCNFCSLLVRYNIPYSSLNAYKLLKNIVKTIRRLSPNIQFVQNRVCNNGEVDIEPLISLIKFDRISETILMHSCIQKSLNIVGFSDIQLADVFDSTVSLIDLIPQDLLDKLPIYNRLNYAAWHELIQLLK